jgi:methylmalonyl-CoA mutase N-terminal domain/subunit
MSGSGERRDRFVTASGRPLARVYGPADLSSSFDYARDLGDPGTYPFARGLYPDGYRSRVWTIRQFSGFGTPEEANGRYKTLLANGATGLSVAFDLPTLMGRDPDHPLSQGEVGRCGVSVASLADMETLFDGIDVGTVTTSMTINSPAPVLFAMYLVMAERQGVAWERLSGTIQNDILKEFIAQKEFIYPPRPSMRFVIDSVAFGAARTPRWNTISVSGYHIREAGATALQELAMTLRDGVEYVEWGLRAGLALDAFVPHLSFFFIAESDLFEEVAKFRAARRLWADLMRVRFGSAGDRLCHLRFHAQTAGSSLTVREPYNNVARTTWQALAAVLGGASSLHTNALDEALGLPTEEAALLALRTQQILAHETGLTGVVDPLGGSWFLERLTRDLGDEARAYIERIDGLGGMVAAIEAGVPQREIAEAAYARQQAIDRRELEIVGVNVHEQGPAAPVPVLAIDEAAAARQTQRVADLRRRRTPGAAERALDALRAAARGQANTMEPILECVRAYATVGEMCDALRDTWGEYVEPPSI